MKQTLKYWRLSKVDESWLQTWSWPKEYNIQTLFRRGAWYHRYHTCHSTDLSLSWRPPAFIRERSEEKHAAIRDKYHIIVEGDDVPPPIETFKVCCDSPHL